MKIHPEALKALRKRSNLSQDALAEKSGVSKKTISRIETERDGTDSRPRTLQQLAKALGVDQAKLTVWPPDKDHEGSDEFWNYYGKTIKLTFDRETALAFAFIEGRYNVLVNDIIEAAPLLFTLVAEMALDYRRQNLRHVKETIDRFDKLMQESYFLPLGDFVHCAWDMCSLEESAINSSDLFGLDVDKEIDSMDRTGVQFNALVKYMQDLVGKLSLDFVKIVERDYWSIPEYRIGRAEISQITGDNDRAIFALINGFAKIRDIPDDYHGYDAQARRIEWLSEQVPQEIWDKYYNRFDLL